MSVSPTAGTSPNRMIHVVHEAPFWCGSSNDSLGSYLRDALQEGGAVVAARLPVSLNTV
jgi:hypothetical protein